MRGDVYLEIKLVRSHGETFFVYQSPTRIYKERISDIIYFERGGRRVTMLSRASGAVELYGSLSQIYRLLSLEGFEYINQSVIVNFFHITNVKNNSVKISDGNSIEISRGKRQLIMNRFCDIINK